MAEKDAPRRNDALGYLSDVLAVMGTGLMGYGAFLIHPPAGFLLVGALMLAAAVAGARRG